MSKRGIVSVMISLLFSLTAALAQEAGKAPKPGPEHKRLGYFVGKWTSEAETKASPFGPAGKITMSDTYEWFTGGFSVVCHSQGKGPMGQMKGLAIMSYSPEEKNYTYYAVESMGMAEMSKGTVKGDTWTWTSESKMGGKVVKSRFIIKELSPSSYSYKWETPGASGSWTTIMEGKETKVK